MAAFPEILFDFAFFPRFDENIDQLSELAETEDWGYQNTESDYALPVLRNYVRFTYARLAEEGKIEITDDGAKAVFNSGLVTETQEPIYAMFVPNEIEGRQPWFFSGWYRRGEYDLTDFAKLPDMANYYDNPHLLVMDVQKELRPNLEHIIADNKERFPAPFNAMDNYMLQTFLKGAIDNAIERVRRNYKAAIPQFHRGQVQLLLPLCISEPSRADLALVVNDHGDFYRAATCLTLDMAYNNARQLARPDRDWLQP
ncbi:DUF3825 domain-containing protein [Desulfovibrio sp. Huiquan2017]|uniref:DUF3825 domain-containing protein n=1 Tax=Desulfovibrio sp. Huiquan2017 TaxID=2816861 RepID=UPI001A9229D0|nr:DUF3825 domain-containing protein [Desulfovibrio sp. Huiquan2017]